MWMKIEDTKIMGTERKSTKRRGRPPKEVWPCKHCKEVFKSKDDFYTHNNLVHNHKIGNHKVRYTCKLCRMEFLRSKELEEHLKLHEETKFICTTCGQFFDTCYKYSLHLYEHDSSKGYLCPICSFTTPRQKSIATHINGGHFIQFEYVCKHCGVGFKARINLMEHEEMHLLGNSARFLCVVCQRSFSDNEKLTMHQTYHHRVLVKPECTYACDVCGKSYAKEYSLAQHLRNFHGEESSARKMNRIRKCSICNKHYTSLGKHMTTHENYKPYKCGYCGKGFPRRDTLAKHEIIHTGEKPHVCKTCGKRFSQQGSLGLHMRRHTGVKPFKCNFCNRAFIAKAHLNWHLKSCSE